MGALTTGAVVAITAASIAVAGSAAYTGYQMANQPDVPTPGQLPEDPAIAAQKETQKRLDEERRLAGARGRASTVLSGQPLGADGDSLGVGTDIFGSVGSNRRYLGA
jgi:hypothetical protein